MFDPKHTLAGSKTALLQLLSFRSAPLLQIHHGQIVQGAERISMLRAQYPLAGFESGNACAYAKGNNNERKYNRPDQG